MADFHQMVVHDVCQVIGRQIVGRLIEHFVVENIGVDFHLATDKVLYIDIHVRLHFESNDILLASCDACIHFLLAESERVAHLLTSAGIVLEVGNLSTLSLQLLRSIKCDIGIARSEKLVHILVVDLAALALAIWAVIALAVRSILADTFVDLNAEPC